MTDKERFDACMKQAEFAAGRHDGRRQYEWKVTLGLWALIAGAIGFLKGRPLPAWIGPVIVLTHGFLWLRGVWVANQNDKAMADHYRAAAETILRDPQYAIPASPGRVTGLRWAFGFLADWAQIFQLVATVILVWLAYIFVR